MKRNTKVTCLFCSIFFFSCTSVKSFQGLQILSEVAYSIIEVMDFPVFCCQLDFPLALEHYLDCYFKQYIVVECFITILDTFFPLSTWYYCYYKWNWSLFGRSNISITGTRVHKFKLIIFFEYKDIIKIRRMMTFCIFVSSESEI